MPAVTPELASVQAALAALDSRYVDAANLPWRETRWPTIKAKVLMEDSERGIRTMLMYWEAGTEFPAHEHVDIEQTYVLEGSFEDSQGVCRAVRLAASRQQPHRAHGRWLFDAGDFPQAEPVF